MHIDLRLLQVTIPRSDYNEAGDTISVFIELVTPTEHKFRRVHVKLIERAFYKGIREPVYDAVDYFSHMRQRDGVKARNLSRWMW